MNILIVDDHPLVRKGLAATLAFEENIEQIKEAATVEESINYITRNHPDVVIVDLRLGNENGLDIVEKIRAKGEKTKFIILTSFCSKEDFKRAKALDVEGYLLKESFAEDILYALRTVLRGKKFCDFEVMQQETQQQVHPYLDELTSREKDVLAELGNGLSNLEIAHKLFISEHTVKKHISNILSKLELTHRTQAALLINKAVNI